MKTIAFMIAGPEPNIFVPLTTGAFAFIVVVVAIEFIVLLLDELVAIVMANIAQRTSIQNGPNVLVPLTTGAFAFIVVVVAIEFIVLLPDELDAIATPNAVQTTSIETKRPM